MSVRPSAVGCARRFVEGSVFRSDRSRVALIVDFFPAKDGSGSYRTKVECGWRVDHSGSEPLLQLSTYGSDSRKSEKKVSQSLHLDREAAGELLKIIERAFPGL